MAVQNNTEKMVMLQAFAKGVLESYCRGLEVHLKYSTSGKENFLFPTATSRALSTASM
jgi:site-specific recombinase XerD